MCHQRKLETQRSKPPAQSLPGLPQSLSFSSGASRSITSITHIAWALSDDISLARPVCCPLVPLLVRLHAP